MGDLMNDSQTKKLMHSWTGEVTDIVENSGWSDIAHHEEEVSHAKIDLR